MGMKEDADAIRAGVGLEAIAELLAEFPPSEQTGKREPGQISTKKAAKVSKAATEIPAGYEIVDVMLPAHQAFIVRKWAEAAQAEINSKRTK